MKKIVLVLLIFAVVGGTAFAFDISSFPDPIEPGNILISPTFNLGGLFGYGAMLGITAAGDYALPIPFMVGLESGFAFLTVSGGPKLIPILARFSWHPNFEVDSLDIYARLKLGYTVGFGSVGAREYGHWSGGFSFGTTAGVRYFFSDVVGVFGDLGWDGYGVSYRWNDDYDGYYSRGYRFTWWVYTYLHVGVSFKLDGWA